MTYKRLPATLAKSLRDAGLEVVEIDGWQTRGRPASTGEFKPVGVLNHHTGAYDSSGDFADDLTYARWMFTAGRSDLPAPLCHLSLSTEGVVYLGAAGRANHAGTAKASGSVAGGDGNALYVGIEWMLSGKQPIPAQMYAAGATLNAVLLKVLGSSAQAVSCHYQTSTTGKWDIGDPNGVPFKGTKVLNVPKFRDAVQKILRPPTKHKTERITFQHTPMQFSDTPAEQQADAEQIFKRARQAGKAHLSGTETAPGTAVYEAVKAAAKKYGYRLHVARSVWVAIDEQKIKKGTRVQVGYEQVIESHEGTGKHTDRGIVWITYTHAILGTKVTHGCAHYLTNGRKPGQPNFVLNQRLAAAIGDWARDKGKKGAIVTYAGDQNIVDRTEDTFFGSPLTSLWDELKKYEDTGHGNIDVIATYDGDGRVTATSIDAKTDKEFRLAADHFLLDGAVDVLVLAA